MTNVILAIDTINGFCKEGAIVDREIMTVVPNIINLVNRKIDYGWKIIFLADNHKPDDLEFQRFSPHCIAGTEEVKVIDELKRFVDKENYIPKTRYSGFYGNNLEEILEKENPEKIIVIGAWTEICVLYTIADLCNRDYKVIVPKDCVKALDIDNEDVWLNHIENVLGAKIVDKQEEI